MTFSGKSLASTFYSVSSAKLEQVSQFSNLGLACDGKLPINIHT